MTKKKQVSTLIAHGTNEQNMPAYMMNRKRMRKGSTEA